MNSAGIRFISLKGIWRLLLTIAGVSAEERGDKYLEPIDLVKAIYIVDLEHVAEYWDDWKNFEKFVLSMPLIQGKKHFFIHRQEYLFRYWSTARENPGQFMFVHTPSPNILEVAEMARELVESRGDENLAPTSCDFLYCACIKDSELSKQLHASTRAAAGGGNPDG